MPKKWYLPETVSDIEDSLENLACIIAFLRDLTIQKEPGSKTITLSEQGQHGFSILLSDMEDCLYRSAEVLLESKETQRKEVTNE